MSYCLIFIPVLIVWTFLILSLRSPYDLVFIHGKVTYGLTGHFINISKYTCITAVHSSSILLTRTNPFVLPVPKVSLLTEDLFDAKNKGFVKLGADDRT